MYGLFWHRKLATLVLMGILIFMIFTSFSSSTQDKTYSSKDLSFNYPKTWSIDENSVIRTGNDGIGKIEKLGSIKDYAEYYMVPATLDGIATICKITDLNLLTEWEPMIVKKLLMEMSMAFNSYLEVAIK